MTDDGLINNIKLIWRFKKTCSCSKVLLRAYLSVEYSRHTDERRVASIQEGAVDHLQDEGGVLERQVWGGGAHREQQALQRRQEEGEDRGSQISLLLTLTYKHTDTLNSRCYQPTTWEPKERTSRCQPPFPGYWLHTRGGHLPINQ